MRVLWVGDALCSTGFARCTHAACDALHEAGHEVRVIGMNYFGDPSDKPYRIIPAYNPFDNMNGLSFGSQLGGYGRWPSQLGSFKPDVAVILNDSWNVPGYFAVLDDENERRREAGRAEIAEPPVVGWIAVDAKNQRGDQLERLSHVAVWTSFAAREIGLGGYDGPCSIVPLGVDAEKFYQIDKSEARARVIGDSFPADAFVVGIVGRNQERKRIDLSLRYFAKWIDDHEIDDAWLFLHVAPTGEQACDIQSLVSYYGLDRESTRGGRVILLEPHIGHGLPEEMMPFVYGCFDLYWSTSQAEGWGLPALEAMACGVPTLLPSAHAFAEWTGEAAFGYGCSSTAITAPLNARPYTIGSVPDEMEAVRALDYLYRNRSALDAKVEKGLALARGLTWERSGRMMVELLEEVVGERGANEERGVAVSV